MPSVEVRSGSERLNRGMTGFEIPMSVNVGYCRDEQHYGTDQTKPSDMARLL